MGWLGPAWIGALLATFLITRLALWLSRKRPATLHRLIWAHGLSFGVAFLISGFGYANQTTFAAGTALMIYLPPQIFWFLVDTALLRNKLSRGAREKANEAAPLST